MEVSMSSAHALTVTRSRHLKTNLSALGKSLLPFNLKAAVGFLFGDQKKKKSVREAGK